MALLFSGIAMADNDSTPPSGMSQDDWDKHREISAQFERERIERFENELKHTPPVPPWIKYPDYSRYDMFWRMGVGETYISEYISPYFQLSTKQAIQEYRKKYPEPNSWSGWYDE